MQTLFYSIRLLHIILIEPFLLNKFLTCVCVGARILIDCFFI